VEAVKKVEPDQNGSLRSEGKILEVTPILYMPDGTLLSLPPTTYLCPNWLLGYQDFHVQGYPFVLHLNERTWIPGTNSAYGPMLGFTARIYENSPGMALGGIPEISEEWVTMFAILTETSLTKRVAELEKRNN
jgi:hypothetical protein